MTSNGSSINDKEIDFLRNLKAFVIRNKMKIVNDVGNSEGENSFDFPSYVFCNEDGSVYLSIDEIFEYLKK